MKTKKLLLVSVNVFTVPYPVYPLGLSYISTYLIPRLPHYEIEIFDFNLNDLNNYIDFLKEYKPNHIGISMRNVDDVNSLNRETFVEGYKKIITATRENSNACLTIGGSGYSIYPEKLFNQFNPDFGIYGEGEESYMNLINAVDEQDNYTSIEGLVYKKNGKVVINAHKNYYRTPEIELNENLIDFYWQNSGMLNIQTKRGCPFDCIYCTYPLIEGKEVRTLEPDKIVESIKRLYDEKGIDYYFFTDSIFNIHDDFNIRLAQKLIQSGINIKWGAYFSPYKMPESTMKLLKKSGLHHIEFGTDSISNTQLINYEKKFRVKDIIQKSELCNMLEIYFAHFLILGGFGETDRTIDETFENSKLIDNSVFFPFIGMRIYPGTKLHQIALKEGKISADDNLIEPKYYISENFDINSLKSKSKLTGKRWVFPDEDLSDGMIKFRKKNKKGPLWEYLII